MSSETVPGEASPGAPSASLTTETIRALGFAGTSTRLSSVRSTASRMRTPFSQWKSVQRPEMLKPLRIFSLTFVQVSSPSRLREMKTSDQMRLPSSSAFHASRRPIAFRGSCCSRTPIHEAAFVNDATADLNG